MNSMNELVSIAKDHGGIIETKIAAERGVSKNMLYKLCKKSPMPSALRVLHRGMGT